MKITNRFTLTLITLSVFACATACGNSTEQKNTGAVNKPADQASSNAGQTGAATPESAKPEATKDVADASPAGSLATPTDAFKTAYVARQKKDIEGLKRAFSKDALEFFSAVSEGDTKSPDPALKQMVAQSQAPNSDVRNEKIDGDKATLEYQNTIGEWVEMNFLKEGGEWKLTLPRRGNQK
ncbi:MAG TPA: hypothetical protein VGO96_02080 [Pyrinomonadaceae bacterium]|nr:hypothetical protein [Pyrinomonadaceae bacterium]